MAWIAALIGGGLGLAGSAASGSASKKAAGLSGGALNQAYKDVLPMQQPYLNVGNQGLYSLASLMGMQGYRTPEEIAYNQYLATKPTMPGQASTSPSNYSAGLLAGQPQRQLLGDNLANAASPLTVLGGPLAFNATSNVFGRDDHKSRMAAAAAAAANKKAMEKYNQDLAAWEAKRAELEQASTGSLANYNPAQATQKALEARPGYQYRYDTGLNTTENALAKMGMSQSGRAQKELTQYGQNFGSNEFGNEYNRLMQLAGMGQNTANSIGNLRIGQGTNLANMYSNLGQADASMYGNMNNVIQGSLANYLTAKKSNSNPYGSSYGTYMGGPVG